MPRKLLLPLHCYDEAGRVLPPRWLHWISFWGCRAIIILVAAFMLRENGDILPKVFFPETAQLAVHIALGIGYLGIWLTIGRREWFWKKGYSLFWLKYAFLLLVSTDVVLQLAGIVHAGGAFDPAKGISLLLTSTALVVLIRSKHFKIMLNDWR